MTVSAVVTQTMRDKPLNVALAESLMIVLACYFTTRRVVELPPDVLDRLEREGQLPPDKHPLYLPRFSIRLIIFVSFVGLAAYMFQRGKLFEQPALTTIGLAFAYFIGVVVRGLGKFFGRWKLPEGLLDWFADLRAIVVIGAVGTLTVCYWLDRTDVLPPEAESITLSLLLFYFGSR
jgi:hypothetical protein